MLARRLAQPLVLLLLVAPMAVAQQPAPAAPPTAAAPPTGRITGRVIDRETGRPLQGARIVVVGNPGVTETDLDGRYRTSPVPAGLQRVRAAFIGYKPALRDSIQVPPGAAAVEDFALTVQAVELEELTVETAIPAAPKTDAGLLAAQQAAPSASDGISAEAITRNPDANGGDVIRRVTGITVFDKKYVVVRGLNERYSNTLLNGVDLPSPEPLKKVVPLDIFPASLLESIVTTKSATPDKPGDFAGGSVEVRTKEFPENPVLQLSVSQGYNSQSTFDRFAEGPRTFRDALAFGADRRRPSRAATSGKPLDERAMESFRDVWTGTRQQALPNLGFGINWGGQTGERHPFGWILSTTYGSKRTFTPGRLSAYFPSAGATTPFTALRVDESATTVDWGAIGNFSWRVGGGHKLGWKNLYTRNAEETLSNGSGLLADNDIQYRYFGAQYVERSLYQSQLSGEHSLGFLAGSRFEWKGTYARATRDEPDNRQAKYNGVGPTASLNTNRSPSNFAVRDLRDRILTGQGDLAVPFGLRHTGDAQFKVGGLYRDKKRTFNSTGLTVELPNVPGSTEVAMLPPEQAFAPENVGTTILLVQQAAQINQSYDAFEHLTAVYGMLDVPLLSRVRLVGGVRVEDWRLYNVTSVAADSTISITRRNRDPLWSANLTIAVTDVMNLRLAGFRSVTRPDPRDISLDQYLPIGSDCSIGGDTSVVRTSTNNADARWEYYPRAGEIFAISGFYKKFDKPLVESVVGSGGAGCIVLPANAESAKSYGIELEARRRLDFLPGPLRNLSLGVNATILNSDVVLDTLRFGKKKPGLDLQGQSPFLLNASLVWVNTPSGTSVSLLYNYFGDRIARYGGTVAPGLIPPNLIESGRSSLDAKVSQTLGALKLALGATNLTNRKPRYLVEGTKLVSRTAPVGTTWTLGLTYDVF